MTTGPECCKKCGSTSLEIKHVGPHIGWYCTKCGAWLRWIKQNKKKPQEPQQLSMEDFGITMPEEKTCKPKIEEVNSLYDDDSLPWE